MLSIEVNSIPLELPRDFSITLNLKSPMFNDIGDYSFPFRIPSTITNKSILGWKHRMENLRDQYEFFDGTLSYNGLVVFSGKIRIKEANLQYYEGALYVQKGSFNYLVKEVYLNELDLGSKTFNNEGEALMFYDSVRFKSYPEADFNMPECLNFDYFDPQSPDAELNCYNRPVNNRLNLVTTMGSRTLLVPMFYLRYVINKVCSLMGYSVKDEFFSVGNDLPTLVIYNSFSVNELYWTINELYYQVHMPHVKVGKFFTDLQKFFNCTFLVDDILKSVRIVGNKDRLRSQDYIEFSKNVISVSNQIPDKVEGIRLSMTADNGDKVYQDLADAESDFIDHVKPSVETFADLPPRPITALFDLRYVVTEDKWYRFGASGANSWEEVSPSEFLYINYYYGKPLENSKTEIGICMVCPDGDFRGRVGNLGSDYANIVPKLAFASLRSGLGYYGVSCFPYADNLRIIWYGSNGLFNTFHKGWLDWSYKERKSVLISKQIDHIELKSLDFGSKYMIGGIKYLLSDIQVTFTMDTIKPAAIKAYSCL